MVRAEISELGHWLGLDVIEGRGGRERQDPSR